jgi:hypothetical protein
LECPALYQAGALLMVLFGQVRSFNWTVRAGEYFSAGFFNVVPFSLSRGGAAVEGRLISVRCCGRMEDARRVAVPSNAYTAILKEQGGNDLRRRSKEALNQSMF